MGGTTADPPGDGETYEVGGQAHLHKQPLPERRSGDYCAGQVVVGLAGRTGCCRRRCRGPAAGSCPVLTGRKRPRASESAASHA